MRTFIATLSVLCLSGGWYARASDASEPTASLTTVADLPFSWSPSVAAEMTFDSQRSNVGWGSFDLSAAPEHDDIRVDVLVGTPSAHMRWHRCGELRLRVDGHEERVQARWAGVRMSGGIFDAVTAALTIEHVRALARAKRASAELCGESFELTRAQRARLRAFVENFDDIATYHGPSAPTPKPELGPDHDYFPDPPRWRPIPA